MIFRELIASENFYEELIGNKNISQILLKFLFTVIEAKDIEAKDANGS